MGCFFLRPETRTPIHVIDGGDDHHAKVQYVLHGKVIEHEHAAFSAHWSVFLIGKKFEPIDDKADARNYTEAAHVVFSST